MIKTFSPFGYEGSIVTVEVDLRKGLPAIDIVGLADGVVKETRERMKSAIVNSGFEVPRERVLIALSPCDLKKEGASFDLPIALAVLAQKDDYPRSQDAEVLVMGELELSGGVRNIRGVNAALQTAVSNGIKYAIVPHSDNLEIPKGIKVQTVGNLEEAYYALARIDEYEVNPDDSFFMQNKEPKEEFKIEFNELEEDETSLDEIKGLNGLKYAMAVAVAGHHNIITWGEHGCGKTTVLQRITQLLPKLLPDERASVNRIYSLAGLGTVKDNIRPFRIPHQTVSLERMCGGGVGCQCGEMSLAHNGVLFLDEAAEFKCSVLQMTRVPLESKSICLSRAGRSTVFPANFQLVMATNPCPCGNYGSKDKICLCSMKSLEMYWRKFSAPLLDRVEIRFDCDKDNSVEFVSLAQLRKMIKDAWERQYQRQGKLNNDLPIEDVATYIKLSDIDTKIFDNQIEKNGYSPRAIVQIKKMARTFADMNNREEIVTSDLMQAMELHGKLPMGFE